MRTTVPPEKAPNLGEHLKRGEANAIVAPVAWKSPTVWAAALVAVLGALAPFLSPPYDRYDQIALAVLAALGISGARVIALNASQQAANRTPGDAGAKVADGQQ